MTTAERIATAISRARISYRELSKQTKIPTATLQRYAMGKTKAIPIDKVEAIAKATNVSSEYILGWTDDINYVSSVVVTNNSTNTNSTNSGNINIAANNTTSQENALLDMFRRLDEVGKAQVIVYIKELLNPNGAK